MLKAPSRAAGLSCPGDGSGQEVGVHPLREIGRATREMQRLSVRLEQRRVGANRGDQIHGAAEGLAEDHPGPEDGPVPVPAVLALLQKVRLQPVEVRHVASLVPVLARRNRNRPHMDAIRFCALQERHVTQARRTCLHGAE